MDDAEVNARVMADQRAVPLVIDFRVASVMFACLKVAMRHPQLHDSLKQRYKKMSRQLEQVMAEYDPKVLRVVNSSVPPTQLTAEQHAVLHAALNDSKPLSLFFTVAELWLWIGCAQVALTHREVSAAFRHEGMAVAQRIALHVLEAHPYAQALLVKGWTYNNDS